MSEFSFKHFSTVAIVHTMNVATIKKDKKELDFVLFLLEKRGWFSFILGVFESRIYNTNISRAIEYLG